MTQFSSLITLKLLWEHCNNALHLPKINIAKFYWLQFFPKRIQSCVAIITITFQLNDYNILEANIAGSLNFCCELRIFSHWSHLLYRNLLNLIMLEWELHHVLKRVMCKEWRTFSHSGRKNEFFKKKKEEHFTTFLFAALPILNYVQEFYRTYTLHFHATTKARVEFSFLSSISEWQIQSNGEL